MRIWLLKLNYQAPSPSNPPTSPTHRAPQNITLMALSRSPPKHPDPAGPLPSPSPLALPSQQAAAGHAAPVGAAHGDVSASLLWHCSSSWLPWAWRWHWHSCHVHQVCLPRIFFLFF